MKTLLLASPNLSHWKSCRSICANLRQAYLRAFENETETWAYGGETAGGLVALARRIRELRPPRVAFIDHQAHPLRLLLALRREYGPGRALPDFHFHVYGDFTLELGLWLQAERVLRHARARFICASERQAALVRKLVRFGRRHVAVCPFPVDTAFYRPSEQLRVRTRRRYGIKPREHLVLYTGRISHDKNVTLLMRHTMKLAAESRLPIRLFIAGPFDDLGSPFFGFRPRPGASYQNFARGLASLPATQRSRVHYLGCQTSEELVGLYNGADCFASLSTYHDEDYGMSPVEALACGSPALLSDWGGYASFVGELGDGALVPVGFAHERAEPGIDIAAYRAELERRLRSPSSAAERQTRAERASARFSTQAAANILAGKLAARPFPFDGFTPLMGTLARRMNQPVPFPQGRTPGGLYEQIYEAYLSKNPPSEGERMVHAPLQRIPAVEAASAQA